MTWEAQNPKLWKAVTLGYGEGWWDTTLEEISAIERDRECAGLCVFCGKNLAEQEEVVVVEPPRPWVGAFCSAPCANDQLWFYCIREGK